MRKQTHLNLESESRMTMSRMPSKRNPSKLSVFETNIENYISNQKFGLEKINPDGLLADAIYVDFTGVIESAELFLNENDDLQVTYQIVYGEEWHNETREKLEDSDGMSGFCQAQNGRVHFSLSFSCLLACVYVQSWPQLIMTIKGFSNSGEIITKGYAQIHLSISPGIKMKQAYIYSIHRQQKWYERIFRFLAPNPLALEEKQYGRIIAKGEGREVESIRSIGKILIRTEAIKRNYEKFGYR